MMTTMVMETTTIDGDERTDTAMVRTAMVVTTIGDDDDDDDDDWW